MKNKNHKDKGLILKICAYIVAEILFICLILLGLTGITFKNVHNTTKEILYKNTLDSYKSEIKSEVQSIISVINMCYTQYISGAMTETEAKQTAISVIRNMRYGDDNSGYFWIDDTNYNLIMHPILKEQIDIISSGAESNAAVTEEINASSQELNSLLETINSNCYNMTNMVEDLNNNIDKFNI